MRLDRFPYAAPCLCLAALLLACHGDSSTGPVTSNEPIAAVSLVSGDGQSGEVGKELAQPLVARVTDAQGRVLSNRVVNFRVIAGNGSVFAGAATTSELGIVQERWTLGTVAADSQRVEVRAVDAITGEAHVYAVFRAMTYAGPAAAITALSASGLSAPAGAAMSDSLRVRVADRYGNPVRGQIVRFAPAAGAGTVSPDSAATDSAGRAATRFLLGLRVSVPDTVLASVPNVAPLALVVTASLPADARVAISGDGQTGRVATTFPDPLGLRVTTSSGQPLPGVEVTWASGGNVVPSASTTDTNGEVRAAFTASNVAGPQWARAYVGAQVYEFHLDATATDAATVTVLGPSGTPTGFAGVASFDPVTVEVRDAYNNVVPGLQLTFAASDNGSVSSPVPLTDDKGQVVILWTLGTRVDSVQTLRVSAPGGAQASLNARAQLPNSATIAKFAGDSQTTSVGTTFRDSLAVIVRLADGRAVQGSSIAWRASSGTTSPASSRTGADGVARTSLTASNFALTQTVYATADNGPTATFAETQIATAATRVQAFLGNFQAAAAGAQVRDSLSAMVRDATGNGVPGVQVSWNVVAGGGSLSSPTSVTGPNGRATVAWTLGGTLDNSVTASVGGGVAPATFQGDAITGATNVLAGMGHTCLVSPERALFCTGQWPLSGGLPAHSGDRFFEDDYRMVRVARDFQFKQVVTAYRSTCGLTDAGMAYCWGENQSGQLGTGDTTGSYVPRPVSGGLTFNTLSIGASQHICGVTPSGEAYCWGSNSNGETGNGTKGGIVTVPSAVVGGLRWKAIAVAGDDRSSTCGVTDDGRLYCWGGRAVWPVATPTPIAVSNASVRFVRIATSNDHACAVSETGTVYCWGIDNYGELGRGMLSPANPAVATPIASTETFTDVAAGSWISCGIASSGTAFCWGAANWTGTDASGAVSCSAPGSKCVVTPAPVVGGLDFTTISIGWGSLMTCGTATDRRAYCWGTINWGATKTSTTDYSSVPKVVLNQP